MNQSYRGKNGSSHNGYKSGSSQPRRQRGNARVVGLAVVLVLLVGAGAGILFLMNQGNKPAVGPTQSAQASVQPDGTKFVNGVYVDDIALGGLTREQAEQQVKAKQDAFAASAAVTLSDGSQTTVLKLTDTNYSYDTGSVLDQAFQAGKDGTDLSQNPVKLTTKITVDPSKLEQKVRDLAAPYVKPAVDAAYTGLDATTHKPQFSADVPGQQVDADALWSSVKEAFTSGKFGTVQMQVVPLPAKETLASLQENLQLFTTNPTGDAAIDAANVGHTFTTPIKNHAKERLTNISLVGEAVNGLLMPGDTLSVNGKTGARTAAKGYQIAPVDINGISDIGLGGGACQVSGTLYNAAIRYGGKFKVQDTTQPGLTILERNVHSMPSAYMKMGTDATVDYPGKDLKIRNDFTSPVLIVVYYDKDTKGKYWEHCDIYGPKLPDGVSYNMTTKLIKTLDPLPGQRKQATSGVKPGTTQTLPAHKGYVLDVFVEKVNADGTKTDTKIYRDTYQADCEVIAWYKEDPEPTDTPTPSPSDTGASPSPTVSPSETNSASPSPSPSPESTKS